MSKDTDKYAISMKHEHHYWCMRWIHKNMEKKVLFSYMCKYLCTDLIKKCRRKITNRFHPNKAFRRNVRDTFDFYDISCVPFGSGAIASLLSFSCFSASSCCLYNSSASCTSPRSLTICFWNILEVRLRTNTLLTRKPNL